MDTGDNSNRIVVTCKLPWTWLFPTLLLLHAGLLAWMAFRHSATTDEPVYLVSGLSHLELGQYDLCRVNPPLVRTVAAVPVFLTRATTNWTKIDGRPGSRSEWAVAAEFLSTN